MKWKVLSLLAYLFILKVSVLKSQENPYNFIETGEYAVGFHDSIIFNADIDFNVYGYKGPAPIFLQLWFPLLDIIESNDFLTYGQLRKRQISPVLEETYEKLCDEFDKSFISYNISEDFPDYNPIDYGEFTYEDVLDSLKTFRTMSQYSSIPGDMDFPVIVYHHGSQGFPDENFIMAEYFASQGYIFVSAAYHLPYPGSPYGLTEGISNNSSAEKKVISFAQSLSPGNRLFYTGHSWGAQKGWTILHENGLADAFVSMETTIEFKTEKSEIHDKWPFVYDAIVERGAKISIPVLMFANTRTDSPFEFFRNTGKDRMLYVSAKEEFGHESYTSSFLLRYFYRDVFPQPDTAQMHRQFILYGRHLEIMEEFFKSASEERKPEFSGFLNDFFIVEETPGI